MNKNEIIEKFGNIYIVDDDTFKMGIDHRITTQIAKRFQNLNVLETCSGAGFSTISLARTAHRVTSIEINPINQNQAKQNILIAGLIDKVDFILDDALDFNILSSLPEIDAAFLDPDWNDKGPEHIYKFKDSNMKPPADQLLNTVFKITNNVAIILPPYIEENELISLPEFELQKIYIDGNLVLFCVYFGSIVKVIGNSEMRI